MLNKSESISEIAKALSAFQGEVSNAKKDAKVSAGSIKYNYATLETVIDVVRPILAKNGLSFVQSMKTTVESMEIMTLLMHSSGEWIECGGVTFKVNDHKPQNLGSLMTYGKRYGLMAALGVATEEDDDGAQAQEAAKNAKPTAVEKTAKNAKEDSQEIPEDAEPTQEELAEIEAIENRPLTEIELKALIDLGSRKGVPELNILATWNNNGAGLKNLSEMTFKQFKASKEMLEKMKDKEAKQSQLVL